MRILFLASSPLLLGLALEARAQASSVASGGEATGIGSVTWSIGQPVYEPVGSITVGVQQPYSFLPTGVNNAPDIELRMAVAPNPTRGSVRLLVDLNRHAAMEYELLSPTGQRLQAAQVRSEDTPIAMETLGAGTYLLRVYTEAQTLRTIRIIKTH